MQGDGTMDGTGLESQAGDYRLIPQHQTLGVTNLTENVKALLAEQADWHAKVEQVAEKITAQFADEIASLVDPAINKSKLTVVKAVSDEFESKLKDILLRKCQ